MLLVAVFSVSVLLSVLSFFGFLWVLARMEMKAVVIYCVGGCALHLVLLAACSWSAMGTAKPAVLEYPGIGRVTVLGFATVEGVEIDLMLDMPQGPRFYSLSWDEVTAAKLQQASEQAQSDGSPLLFDLDALLHHKKVEQHESQDGNGRGRPGGAGGTAATSGTQDNEAGPAFFAGPKASQTPSK